MQNEQVPSRGLQEALFQGLLKEIVRGREVLEEGAPGAELGFAGALDEDVEVGGEGGEEGEDCGEEGGVVLGGRGVDFVVEDGVQEDFEGVGEVGEVLVVVGEGEGGGGVGEGEVVVEDGGKEELRLWGCYCCCDTGIGWGRTLMESRKKANWASRRCTSSGSIPMTTPLLRPIDVG